MDLLDVMRSTGAVREFTNEPVDDGLVYEILDAARFAPNGGNRQGWHAIVVQDAEIRARLAELNELGAREYIAHLRQGLVPFAPSNDGQWHGPAIDLVAARATPSGGFADFVASAPVLLVITVDLQTLSVTDNGLGRQSIVGGGSVYPFCHNILLAARNAGLAGVLTTMLVRAETSIGPLLRVPQGHALAAMIVLGHPVKQITKLRRTPVEEFATLDTFDGEPFQPRSAASRRRN